MSDWRDVMNARNDADAMAVQAEGHTPGTGADAMVFALLAVKEELRALGVLLDFARGDAR